jgi:hypothetical protein
LSRGRPALGCVALRAPRRPGFSLRGARRWSTLFRGALP